MARDDKKIIEGRVLRVARSLGIPIPLNEVPGEEPDFRFNDGLLGVELRELVRPSSCNHGILPVAEEAFHVDVVQRAKGIYYENPDAVHATIKVYFAESRGKRRDKTQMAPALADCVRANVLRANPFVTVWKRELPEGFSSVTIATDKVMSPSGDWWSGESGGTSSSDIWDALEIGVKEKNVKLPTYRKNMPTAEIWLLLWSDFSVSRGLSFPAGIESRKFEFGFDRVFWFTQLDGYYVELQRI